MNSRDGCGDAALTSQYGGSEPRPDAASRRVRWGKVERLRSAIAGGTYRVSSEALAESLIAHLHAQGKASAGGSGLVTSDPVGLDRIFDPIKDRHE